MNKTAAKAMAIADAYLSTKPDSERTTDYSRLTYAEIALVLKLTDDGLNQTEVAKRLGCHASNISRLLKEFSDTRPLARLRAQNSALKLTDRVIASANVEESLEVLDRIGVLEKRQVDTSRSQAVQVVVNMPGQRAITADMIDVSPTPFAPVCPEIGQSK